MNNGNDPRPLCVCVDIDCVHALKPILHAINSITFPCDFELIEFTNESVKDIWLHFPTNGG